jgi:hypothetical protein
MRSTRAAITFGASCIPNGYTEGHLSFYGASRIQSLNHNPMRIRGGAGQVVIQDSPRHAGFGSVNVQLHISNGVASRVRMNVQRQDHGISILS